jgi:hypothetical protein
MMRGDLGKRAGFAAESDFKRKKRSNLQWGLQLNRREGCVQKH